VLAAELTIASSWIVGGRGAREPNLHEHVSAVATASHRMHRVRHVLAPPLARYFDGRILYANVPLRQIRASADSSAVYLTRLSHRSRVR
jgi:hypothetical protein